MADEETVLTPCGRDADGTSYWERVAEETSWGRYLADVETSGLLRGLELAGPPGEAVDLGCGGGRWTKFLADRGWRVTATDIDPDSVAVCQRRVPDARCHVVATADQSIPAPSGSQQLVLCMEVPPVVESDWFPSEAYRVLSSGGVVVGVHFNVRSWRCVMWRWKRRITGHLGDGSYTISYSDWRRRFLRAGFAMLHEESFCWGPFSRVSNSALVPVFAKAERALGLNRWVRWGPWVLFIARKTAANGVR